MRQNVFLYALFLIMLSTEARSDSTKSTIDAAIDSLDSVKRMLKNQNPVDCKVELFRKNVHPKLVPMRFNADFDGDGRNDDVRILGNRITITLSGDGMFTHQLNDYGSRIHDAKIVYLPGSKLPSIVVASGIWRKTDKFVHSLPQKIIFNNKGVLESRDTGIRLVGRGLDCHDDQITRKTRCFFASYGENDMHVGLSGLFEIDGRGRAKDITKKAGLPWPVKFGGWGTEGYHMIGASFLDFNGDGAMDIVAVGQHTRIFTAEQKIDGTFDAKHVSGIDEYMHVSAPKASKGFKGSQPPCVYIAVEKGESKRSDFLSCYNNYSKKWYEIEIPGRQNFMHYDEIMFWDMDGDGNLEFAARDVADSLNMFSLRCKTSIYRSLIAPRPNACIR